MKLEQIEVTKLKPAKYNPRIIGKEEFAGLVESVKKYGQVENLIVNKDMTLISGHQRLNAMIHLGFKTADCYMVDLNKTEEKKLNLLMNSKAIQGSWDELKLAETLETLKTELDYKDLKLDKLEELDLSSFNPEENVAEADRLDMKKEFECPSCGFRGTPKEFTDGIKEN